jgi:hypothetical protein
MNRVCLLLFAVATAGCASSGGPPSVAMPTERTIAVDDQNVYRTTVMPNAKVAIPMAPNRVYDAVKAVYEELGVPPGTFDQPGLLEAAPVRERAAVDVRPLRRWVHGAGSQ